MNDALIVTLVVLTTHYLTYIVVESRLLRSPREYLQLRFENRWVQRARAPERRTERAQLVSESDEWQSLGAYLLSCPWCTAGWIGAGVTLGVHLTEPIVAPHLVWLASAGVTGLLSSRWR